MATKFNSNELNAGPVSRNVDESLIVEINTGAAQNLNVSLENLEPNESYVENNLSPDLEYFLKPSVLIEEEAINDTKIAFVTIKNYAGEDTYDLSKDMHDLYLRNGISYYTRNINQTTDPIENAFAVYFIKNGNAQVIPDYKTLEVLLVKEGLNYRDIRPASPDEILSYDLNFDGRILDPTNAESAQEVGDTLSEYRARLISSRANEWNFRIRKESGYKVSGNFRRDPGDYVRYSENLLFVGYSETVFLDQTATEKLRAKYEGQLVIGGWTPPGEDYNSGIVQSNTKIQGTDDEETKRLKRLDDLVQTARIMILGRWYRWSSVGFRWATLNDIDLGEYQQGQGRYGSRGLFHILVQKNAMEVMAGGVNAAGDNKVYDGGIVNPAWNRFNHITYRVFSEGEYESYFNATNGGKVFENDLLIDYEPPGSIKYYSAGGNPQQTNELLQQLQVGATDETFVTPDVQSLCNDILELTEDLRNDVNNLNFNLVTPISNATLSRINYHKNNLQKMWWITGADDWRVKEKKGGSRQKTHNSVTGAINRANDKYSYLKDYEARGGWQDLAEKVKDYYDNRDTSKSDKAKFKIYDMYVPWTPVTMNRTHIYTTSPGYAAEIYNFNNAIMDGYPVCAGHLLTDQKTLIPDGGKVDNWNEQHSEKWRSWISKTRTDKPWKVNREYLDQGSADFVLYGVPEEGLTNGFMSDFHYPSVTRYGGIAFSHNAIGTLFDRDFTKLIEFMILGVPIDIPSIAKGKSGGVSDAALNASPARNINQLLDDRVQLNNDLDILENELNEYKDDTQRQAQALLTPNVTATDMINFTDRYNELVDEYNRIDTLLKTYASEIQNTSIGAVSPTQLIDELASVYYGQFYRSIKIISQGMYDRDDPSGNYKARGFRIQFPAWVLQRIKNNCNVNLSGINNNNRYAGVG